ncbi:MAG: aspartate carbamoyltransferase catalytic subunit [Planctomycetes bacterium]|nr:aspartate carbamoyltransferase catalytic subunit [Planctomycetota bacterium]
MPAISTDRRHLLSLESLSADEILLLLEVASSFTEAAAGRVTPSTKLDGKIIANLFFEDSTRTRSSFTVAATRLSAQTLDLVGSTSSVSKGESLIDTARTIEAMGVDLLVVRTREAGAPAQIAREVECSVINAGDGSHEHPTQGLLDLLTIQQRFGNDLTGKTIAIVGDVLNSRVARSAIHGLTKLGVNVHLVGPTNLVPKTFEQIATGPGSVEVSYDLDAVLPSLDAIMMLRVQFERQRGNAITSDYRSQYALTVDRARKLPPDAIVMHPGPMNRGLEIDSEVADDPDRSVIFQQVSNGVAVRMAVLTRCLGGS